VGSRCFAAQRLLRANGPVIPLADDDVESLYKTVLALLDNDRLHSENIHGCDSASQRADIWSKAYSHLGGHISADDVRSLLRACSAVSSKRARTH
jgi:hypothetical protein